MAATHAASGVGASVGPWAGAVRDSARDRMGSTGGRLVTVREYAAPSAARVSRAASRGWDTTIAIVTPLAYAVREGSARATNLPETLRRKDMPNDASSGHRKSTVASIVAAGAAIGAGGALVARRRNRAKWAEYEPSALQDDAQAFVDETRTAGRGGDHRPRTASKMAGWAKEHSKSVRDRMHSGSMDADATMDETMAERDMNAMGMTEPGMTEPSMGERGMDEPGMSESDTDERSMDGNMRSSKNGRR